MHLLVYWAVRKFKYEGEFLQVSHKQSELDGDGRRVISDVWYHVELGKVLTSWFAAEQVAVHSETSAPTATSPPRCNILIDSGCRRYALEVMAGGDQQSMPEHMKHLKQYKTSLRADEGWLIHFTLSKIPLSPSQEDLQDASIDVITVCHDFWWKEVMYSTAQISAKHIYFGYTPNALSR